MPRLGEPGIDQDHVTTLRLMDLVRDTLAIEGNDCAIIVEGLERLITHMKVHFLAEELMMRLYKYQDLRRHMLEHERMIEKLGELRAIIDRNDLTQACAEMDKIIAGRHHHISRNDADFAAYLERMGAIVP